jgi:hypothetical protein
MHIRTFRPGDELQQRLIYNTAARSLPGFKEATLEEIARRTAARDFDPATRLYAEENGQIAGYCTWSSNGRVGFPWCLPGSESAAEPLLKASLQAMRDRKLPAAFTAYRTDWTAQHAFMEANGFRKIRDMVNFEQSMIDLPTTINRRGASITPFKAEDIPAIAAMGENIIRIPADKLVKHLTENPYFPESAVFVLRRPDNTPQAVGIFIEDDRYADPLKVDVNAPCFRLGAFGAEGQNAKRINGMFSFLCAPDRDITMTGLDLLWHATGMADPEGVSVLAAQVPSDAVKLYDFYRKYFRRQGSFPIYQLNL